MTRLAISINTTVVFNPSLNDMYGLAEIMSNKKNNNGLFWGLPFYDNTGILTDTLDWPHTHKK